MSNTDQARVTVMRNGQQQDITLNMSQIAAQAEQLSSGNAEPGTQGATPADPPAVPQPDQPPGSGGPRAVRENH